MSRRAKIAIVDAGTGFVTECAQAIEALGFEAVVADVGGLPSLGVEVGAVLLPDGPRAAWTAERVITHPALTDVPLVGLSRGSAEEGSFEAEAWLAFPLEPEAARTLLWHLVARRGARGATSAATTFLGRVSEAAQFLAGNDELKLLVNDFVRAVAQAFEAQGSALILLGKNEREGWVVATHESEGESLIPLDEPSAGALHSRIQTDRPILIESDEGDILLQEALERPEGGEFTVTLTFPVVMLGQPAGGLIVALPPEPAVPLEQLRLAGELLATHVGSALQGSGLMKRIREQTARFSLHKLEREQRSRMLERYKEFFESSSDGVIVLGSDARVIHINRAGEVITGYAVDWLRGRALLEIVAEHHRESIGEIVDSAVQGVPLRNFDLEVLTTSGDVITTAVSASSLMLDQVAAVFVFRDVSEARSIEDELIKTKEFLERLIDSTIDAIVAADVKDGQIILFNRGAENLFARSADDTVSRLNMENLFPDDGYHEILRQLHSPQYGGEGRLEPMQKEIITHELRHVPVNLTASIIYEDDQEVALVAVITDIREQIEVQERLAITQEKLAVSEKQALIAELAGTTAHELNQPLTSVMGYAELLLKKLDPSSPSRHAANVIIREAERMAEIVRKIGKITRYETKSYVGKTQMIDLERAAEE